MIEELASRIPKASSITVQPSERCEAGCESTEDCRLNREMFVLSDLQNVKQRGSSQIPISEKDQFSGRLLKN